MMKFQIFKSASLVKMRKFRAVRHENKGRMNTFIKPLSRKDVNLLTIVSEMMAFLGVYLMKFNKKSTVHSKNQRFNKN